MCHHVAPFCAAMARWTRVKVSSVTPAIIKTLVATCERVSTSSQARTARRRQRIRLCRERAMQALVFRRVAMADLTPMKIVTRRLLVVHRLTAATPQRASSRQLVTRVRPGCAVVLANAWTRHWLHCQRRASRSRRSTTSSRTKLKWVATGSKSPSSQTCV